VHRYVAFRERDSPAGKCWGACVQVTGLSVAEPAKRGTMKVVVRTGFFASETRLWEFCGTLRNPSGTGVLAQQASFYTTQ
jgi:hypothetical protein